MANIPRGYVDALTESLNMLSDAAQRAVESQLMAIEYTDLADLRRQVIEILDPILSVATDYAAAYSSETYDLIRGYSVGEMQGATAHSGRVPEATERAVRGLVERAEVNGYESFVKSVKDRCDYEIKKAAAECTLHNAQRDDKKPRFARVPTGSETCTFCLMLASRGFVYYSEETAGAFDHWHPHCDCRIIQGYPGDKVDGYDPDELYRRWKEQLANPPKRTRTKKEEEEQPVQEKQTEKKKGINWDANVYRKLDPADVDRLATIIDNAPESAAKRLYLKWEEKLSMGSLVERKAHFDPYDVTVNMDVKLTLNDTRRTPGATWFHEHGHQIDYLSNGSEGYIEKVRKFGSLNTYKAWASTSYEDGLFRKTILDEVSRHVSDRLKSLKERRKELIKNRDIEGLFNEEFINKGQYMFINNTKDVFDDDEKEFEKLLKDTVKQVPKARAYKSIEQELRTLNNNQRADLSDIFEGATNCAVRAGWGHGKKYWKDYENLPVEAFAEFFSAELMNPESLAQLEKWLPESKAVFDDILASLEKGTQ